MPHTTAWTAACNQAVEGMQSACTAIAGLPAAHESCSRDIALLEAAVASLRPEEQATRQVLQQAVSSVKHFACHHISPQALLMVSNHKLEWGSIFTEGLRNDATFKPYGEAAGKAFQVSLAKQKIAEREQQGTREAALLPPLDHVDLRQELGAAAGRVGVPKQPPPSRQLRGQMSTLWRWLLPILKAEGECSNLY